MRAAAGPDLIVGARHTGDQMVPDGLTLEEFARKEERENAATEMGQQLMKTLALADRVVQNDGTLEDLHERTRRALREMNLTL